MPDYDFDVLVIGGGGSGGFTAATTAMKSGAKVGMVEAGRLGGLCILAGCMPSKTLIHNAALIKDTGGDGRAQYPRVLKQKRETVDFLAGKREKATSMKEGQGLKVIRGLAVFKDAHTLEVEGRPISAAKIVIATGSTEIIPPVPGLEEAGYLVSDSFMELNALPESLIVLGGGAMALELGQYAARMGVETSLIQRSEYVMSNQDPMVGEGLQKALSDDGVRVFTGTDLKAVKVGKEGKTVVFAHGGEEVEITAQHILVALGRRPASEGLNLEAAGVETERGAVKVDEYLRSSARHIFAAGDVTGVNMVVNLAIEQGRVAGLNATREEMIPIKASVLPSAVFTDPQFARVGLNGAQAQKQGIEFEEAVYKLSGLGVSRTYPKAPEGFMAMRAAKSDGRIIGAEILSPEASSMIHDVAVAMKLGGRPQDIAAIPYVHPCLGELVHYCAHRLSGQLRKG